MYTHTGDPQCRGTSVCVKPPSSTTFVRFVTSGIITEPTRHYDELPSALAASGGGGAIWGWLTQSRPGRAPREARMHPADAKLLCGTWQLCLPRLCEVQLTPWRRWASRVQLWQAACGGHGVLAGSTVGVAATGAELLDVDVHGEYALLERARRAGCSGGGGAAPPLFLFLDLVHDCGPAGHRVVFAASA
mmetsp:Transcript_24799/g.80073  ORF Transcript_24799/g.80073 Transcript_24799/m.80073 type:complete len:190 (+) Transcript_24799:1650-2219(+)